MSYGIESIKYFQKKLTRFQDIDLNSFYEVVRKFFENVKEQFNDI